MYLNEYIFNDFLWGFSSPLVMDVINRRISSDIRATVLSVSNMGVSLSFGLISPLFGRLADVRSLSSAFQTLGIVFLIAGGLVLLPLIRDIKNPAP